MNVTPLQTVNSSSSMEDSAFSGTLNDDIYKFFFFFKQKTAYEIRLSLVGSEMCIETGLLGYLIHSKESVK